MTIETAAHVGPDGRLEIDLPSQFANTDVVLTVRPANSSPIQFDAAPTNGNRSARLEDSHEFVRQFAGCWKGDRLARPDQGEVEVRDELR
ncbi:MAG TPA: hypothetical protein VJ809_08640 [Pirellulales bacterium]|nr:hypothetical protein [Pirellulales bacterium]